MVKRHLLAILVMLLIVAGCTDKKSDDKKATLSPTSTSAASGKIVLADIGDDPDIIINGMQPLADYLAARLGDFGIGIGEVRVAPDLDTMVEWLKSGEVDLYFDSLYPALVAYNEADASPILRRSKYNIYEYHAVFFAYTEQGFTSLDDLKGKVVAFDKAYSTSGYLMPLAYLIENGYTPVEVSSEDAPVDADKIGYIFSGEDDNVLQWVISGRVVAGVLDSGYYEVLIPAETRAAFSIIAATEDVPRQVAVASSDLGAEATARITEILLGLKESEAGRQLLADWQDSDFTEFPEGVEAALAEMQAQFNIVQGQ